MHMLANFIYTLSRCFNCDNNSRCISFEAKLGSLISEALKIITEISQGLF